MKELEQSRTEMLMLNVMKDAEGREFIAELLDVTGVDNGNYVTDPQRAVFLNGRASIGIELLHLMRNSERGAELESIMRREARHPPDDDTPFL